MKRTMASSPEGRHNIQVTPHAGACLGVLSTDGVVLATERVDGFAVTLSEKIYSLAENIVCTAAGLTADAKLLINELLGVVDRYELDHGEFIPCEHFVSRMCNIKKAYRRYGRDWPFEVSVLYMGWDKDRGYQLYQSSPSGNYVGWKVACIGKNSHTGVSMLTELLDQTDMDLSQAQNLAIKALAKTAAATKLTPNNTEMATLTREDGKTIVKILTPEDIDSLLEAYAEVETAAEIPEKEEHAQKS